MLVYVAGPYRADTPEGIRENIQKAREIAISLWEEGHAAICPHLNTAGFEEDCDLQDFEYLEGDLQILARCDAMVVAEDWEESEGTRGEIEFAQIRDIPIYYYPEIPERHITELTCPKQVRGFIDTVMRMYRVHLEKNADYSPANILGPGEIGLATRAWDKMIRLMSLTGWRIDIAGSEFKQPRSPRNESIFDNLLDLAVYSIIWLLYRGGEWGK